MIYEEILLYHYKDFVEEYETKKKKGVSIIEHIINNSNKNIKDNDSDEEDQ